MEPDHLMMKNISYLRARDPSILSYNRPQLSQIKANLLEEFSEKSQSLEDKENQNENIRVYLRIKNGYDFHHLYEIEDNILISKHQQGRNVKDIDSVRKMYTFSKIFEPETTQRDIFNYVVKPKILEFINGQNSTLLTYGASGSGKTFTLIGTGEEPGVVPRSLEYLFRTLPNLSRTPKVKPLPTGEVTLLSESDRKREKTLCRSLLNASSNSLERTQHIKTYLAMQQRLSTEPVAELDDDYSDISVGVWISFAEIYNEQIYDLLQLDPPRGTQRPRLRLGLANGHAHIRKLTDVNVTNGQEAYQILQHGIQNLNYASTQLNKHSSRSHSIFTIKLVQMSNGDGGSYVSCFNFCDLAGSERTKKTQNVGDRLKESNNINSSLLVLGRCISAVRNLQQKESYQKMVPFRESKLTQLFQKALAGEEDIAMIVNMSPTREMFDESQHVLNFSAIAKDISIERRVDPMKKRNRFSQLVEAKDEDFHDHSEEEYKNMIELLRDELEQQRIDLETNQKMDIDYIRQEYHKLLDMVNDERKKSIQKAEDAIRTQYESKMELMRLKYERLLRQAEQKNEVIDLSSSSDEDTEERVEEEDRNELSELKETITDGVRQYRGLETQFHNLELENFKLKETINELQHEVEMYREQITTMLSEEKHSGSDTDEPGEERTDSSAIF